MEDEGVTFAQAGQKVGGHGKQSSSKVNHKCYNCHDSRNYAKKCLKLTDKQKDHVGADFCDIEEAANEIGLDLGPGEEGTDFFNIMEGEDSKDQVA